MKWSHLLIEGYCARKWYYNNYHSKWYYTYDPAKGELFETAKKTRNPNYDPKVKVPKRPKYCKKRICIKCIPCKHFAYAEIEDDLLERFNKMSDDYFKEFE